MSNRITKASAGTGKTHTLTETIIGLLNQENGVQIDNILALTFTEKAASEMRERIFEALDEQITKHAEQAEFFIRQKRNFGQNYISTFHSFCSRVMQFFPEELAEIPIYKEGEEAQVFLDSGFTLISEVLERQEKNVWFRSFLEEHKDDEKLSWILRYDNLFQLKDRFNQLKRLTEDELEKISNLEPSDYVSILNTIAHTHEKEWKSCYNEVVSYVDFDSIFKKDIGQKTNVTALLSLLKTDGTLKVANLSPEFKNGEKSADEDFLQLNQEFLPNLKKHYESWKNLDDFLRQHAQELRHLPEFPVDNGSLNPNVEIFYQMKFTAGLALSWFRWQRFERVKKNALNFDDLIWFTHILFTRFQEVADRFRQQFSYILVDEFQDTDFIQWEIVKAIHRPKDGNLRLVGDMKQAIYAFRGGDVSMMKSVISELGEETLTGSLDKSYRSNDAIVNFTNDFFSRVFDSEKANTFRPDYDNIFVAKESKSAGKTGAVQIFSAFKEDEKYAESTQKWLSERHSNDIEALKITQLLLELKNGTCDIPGSEHITEKMKANETAVGILMRTKSMIPILSYYLRLHGLPASIIGSKDFYKQEEILDLYFLLNVLYDVADDVNLVGLLRSPWVNLSDAGLLALKNQMHTERLDSFSKILELHSPKDGDSTGLWKKASLIPADVKALESFLPKLREWRLQVRNERVSSILLKCLEQGSAFWTYPDREKAQENILKALQIIESLESDGQGSLQEVCSYFMSQMLEENAGESEAEIDNPGSIQIMSIHQSKGLAFPMVIMPNLRSKGNNNSLNITPNDAPFILAENRQKLFPFAFNVKNFDGDEEHDTGVILNDAIKDMLRERSEAEAERLFYVAVTRAETHLILLDFAVKPIISRANNAGFAKIFPEDCWESPTVTKRHVSESDLIQLMHLESNKIEDEIIDSSIPFVLPNNEKIAAASVKTTKASGHAEESLNEEEEIHSEENLLESHDSNQGALIGSLVHLALELSWPIGTAPVFQRLLFEFENAGEKDNQDEIVAIAQNHYNVAKIALDYKFPNPKSVRHEQAIEVLLEMDKGPAVLKGFIDLMVQDEDGNWFIIDYKTTNLSKTETVKDAKESGYAKQLAYYQESFQKLTGLEIPSSHCLLLMTNPSLQRWISLEEMQA